MFERIIMAQTESDVFWIAAPNANCTCDIGKMAVDSTKTSVHFTGRITSSAAGFMTKLSSLGIQQGTKNFGGSGQFYVGRACDIRGSDFCNATGWNDNLFVPIYGVNFVANTTYRSHFWRGSGGSIGLGIYTETGGSVNYLCGQWLEFVEGEYTGINRGWIARINGGSMGWSVVWPSDYQAAFTDCAIMPNGNLVAVGPNWLNGDASMIVIFNPTTGSRIAQKKVVSLMGINSVAVAPDNSIIFGGNGYNQAYIGKMDSTASTVIWGRRYSGGPITNVAIDSGGNVIAIGSISNNVIIYKFDPNGTLLWQRTWDSGGADAGYGLAIGAGDCIYVKMQFGGSVVVAKLPGDGSLTGTYNGWTYAAGAASFINGTFGTTNTAFSSEGTMADYPYSAGNWSNGTITWNRTLMQ